MLYCMITLELQASFGVGILSTGLTHISSFIEISKLKFILFNVSLCMQKATPSIKVLQIIIKDI